jgi:hypothetical protein
VFWRYRVEHHSSGLGAEASRSATPAAEAELLLRVDAALGKAIAQNTSIDEVLPEVMRRRAR